MKRYILFAGCNGVGKSTLYQTNDMFRNMPRVNMDDYDNTDAFVRVARYAHGKCVLKVNPSPSWVP